MRIIKQGVLNNRLKQYKCARCGCIFELDEGEKANKCPYCGYDVILVKELEDEISVKRTPDSVYPDDYYKHGSIDGEKILGVDETRKLIRDCIKSYFDGHGGYATVATGDTVVMITQNDRDNVNDYKVMVAKNYYDLDSYELLDE